ncbi:MAG: HAMP domain-containing histidine kinase [bacterium]|nr:HAMP domain-containing histidine kinase [bacterium]
MTFTNIMRNKLRARFADLDNTAHYWVIISGLASVLSLAVLPFDLHFLDAPAWIPIGARIFCAICLAFATALPFWLKQRFDRLVFHVVLIAAIVLISTTISTLETYAVRTMYYNGIFQMFIAFTFLAISIPMSVFIYLLPVAIYRLIAGPEHFADAQPEILLLTGIALAIKLGLRNRLQKNPDAAIQWARTSAHELKGPLTNIRMISHDLRAGDANSDKFQKALVEIEKLCNRGLAVQNRILLNARYETPAASSELTGIYAGETIQGAIAAYVEQVPEFRALITLNLDLDFEFNGDPVLFENVVHNLIANSARAISTAGKGEIRVTVSIARDRGRIEFLDTGTGIESDRIAHIFRAGVTYAGGTGFGLAFCKAVVDSFHGEISCESEYGRFTRITIALPLN